ncbi:MAG: 16S rRNA (adenine(1518)-N(6)/adenine(1519)-N(6))-dimethyltransferase RsmA [Bacteroidales bacterium]
MDNRVTPKKSFGQHFLHDKNIAAKIAAAIPDQSIPLLEIGPGMGMLTQFLLERPNQLKVIEIDHESVKYLEQHFPQLLPDALIRQDFLSAQLPAIYPGEFGIIGNFPYNISSQILFRTIEHQQQIPVLCGMFQKEVAERIASGHGNKQYGILSVLLQTWYDVKLLFTVNENVFTPPPKVKSAVILISRKPEQPGIEDPALFIRIVKAAFNQRRKMLRNAIASGFGSEIRFPFETLRAEQLSVEQYFELYQIIRKQLIK